VIRAPLVLALALAAGCSSSRAGWASRGRYEVLHESPSLQVRRGSQKIDPLSGELVVAWIGARAPEGFPPLVSCELTLFHDDDGDGVPDASEVFAQRESRETSPKVLFADVRAGKPRTPPALARVVASTARERCVVSWRLVAD
jgi:hypothetical protein